MKKVKCKNCGASFSDELDKCPYCGTMHKKGAYKKFRLKISDVIDSLLGLKVEAERSASRIIFTSILRALILVAACIALAFGVSLFTNTNYYNDREYDERRLNDINWENENIAKLNEAYLSGDYDTVDALFNQNNSVVYNWQHYPIYCLKRVHKNINEDEYREKYWLEDCLYFLYYPEYYAQVRTMSDEEFVEYESMRSDVISTLEEMGYSQSELENIYDNCKDEYGYIDIYELEDYVKGDNNG